MRLRRLLGTTSVVGLLVSDAALATTCYVVAVMVLLEVDPLVFLFHHKGLLRICILVGAIVAGLHLQDLYDDLRIRSRALLVQQICLVIALAFFLQAFLSYANTELVMPRWVMMAGSSMSLVALSTWRVTHNRVLTSTQFAERVLFLGCSTLAWEIAERLRERPEFGMVGIGFVGDPEEGGEPRTGEKLLGALSDLRQIARHHQPDRIAVALSERRNRMPTWDLLELRLSGVLVEEAAAMYEAAFQRVCVRELRPSQLIFTAELGPRSYTVFLQSLYSLPIAALGLLLAAPLMLLISAAVKLSSPGPVLFRQQRVGLNGAPFVLYKFRSMRTDAETGSGAVWASKDDPRVTRAGRWLRRFRLDELPQLFNVLKGEMSIVGPRPERPEFVETLIQEVPFYRQRLCVKPGITGWAQINHRYGDSLEETITKLEYDLYYIKNLTPALDTYIMLQTLKVVLLGRGAQ